MRRLLHLPGVLLALIVSAQARAAEPALWIDVRSPEEFAAGHLPQAINLPYQDVAARIGQLASDKARDIHLYCGVGVRAQAAKFMLEAQGYSHVTNEGGFENLARVHGREPSAPACGKQC